MALTRINLSETLTTSADCSDVALTDSTGLYNITTNPLGYGAPLAATVNSVTSAIIKVNMSGGIYFTYTFTIVNGVITAATVSINGASAVNILSHLTSTAFPFTSISLFSTTYGVTLPSLEDTVLEVDYSIIGTQSGTAYNYTTSSTALLTCSICCCLANLALEIDPLCDCSQDTTQAYLKASSYLEVAAMNMDVGKTDQALIALNKAKEICNSKDCGCN